MSCEDIRHRKKVESYVMTSATFTRLGHRQTALFSVTLSHEGYSILRHNLEVRMSRTVHSGYK